MSINLTVQDGVVKSPALRYDSNSKPELRFTLVQTERDWPLYLPCTAVGAAAERLASEIEDGQHIIVTSGKLCYRKRQTQKSGEVSRLEILVWSVDVLAGVDHQEISETTAPNSMSEELSSRVEAASVPHGAEERARAPKARRPRLPKHVKEPWVPSGLVSEN
jgi:single-stranded DNA-binding protein